MQGCQNINFIYEAFKYLLGHISKLTMTLVKYAHFQVAVKKILSFEAKFPKHDEKITLLLLVSEM